MKIQKLPVLILSLMLAFLLSSCSTSRKSSKSQKRYHQRCDCSRFSELGSNEVITIDWVAYHEGQTNSE